MISVIVGAAALCVGYYCSYRRPSSSLCNACPRTPDGARQGPLRDFVALVWDRRVLQTRHHARSRLILAPRM